MPSLKKNWFQIWYDKFGEFSPNHSKVQKFHSDGLFLSKVNEVWAKKKKYRVVITRGTEQWCKIWKILTLRFQKWHEELGELSSLEHPKVWKLYIDGLFLSKAYTVSVRNFQRNYASWHWRVLQSLNKNWLVGWKMTERIWLIFIRAVESPKIGTLIRSVYWKYTNI